MLLPFLRLVFFGNAIESTISCVIDKSGGFGNERLHLAPDAFTPLHYADVNAGIVARMISATRK